MANIYIEQIREILKTYFQKQKEFNNELVSNSERFSSQYAESENRRVREKQAQAVLDAKMEIIAIFEGVKKCLAKASYLDPSSISESTMKLFDEKNLFDLSASDIEAQIERHSGDFTMLKFIQSWIDRHNEPSGKYSSIRKIQMPSDLLEVYRQFGESAIKICDKIYNNGWSAELDVENYADERMAGNLFRIIGDGMKLSDYRDKIVPKCSEHTFDAISLNLDKGNGNFYVPD